MSDFTAGILLSMLVSMVIDLLIFNPMYIDHGKELVYTVACEYKCGNKENYLDLGDNNNLCICKNGKTYKRDLSKLYR